MKKPPMRTYPHKGLFRSYVYIIYLLKNKSNLNLVFVFGKNYGSVIATGPAMTDPLKNNSARQDLAEKLNV